MPTTIADRSASGPTTGFDYLRIVLAVAVLAWHTLPLTQGAEAASQFMTGPMGWLVRLILPMFFALSGFLVAASLERNTLGTFVIFRGLRILPALAVEVTLSALLLGPILTNLPLQEYFSNRQFYGYFQNVFGIVRFYLPGVFEQNPYPRIVNGSLWTVPYELECYLALVVLALLSIIHKPKWLLSVILVGAVALLAIEYASDQKEFTLEQSIPGRVLILSFLSGALFQFARERIPLSALLCVISFFACVVCLSVPALYVLVSLPAAYVTVWLGLQNPSRLPMIFSGDYSYGIYLYAFPIQQTLVLLVPTAGWLLFPLSLVVVSCFAALSWHCVERPTLRLKAIVMAAGPAWLVRIRGRDA